MALNIAILGTRGIPNNYGGFEQFAGYLSKGLVEKGHSVTVYNSHNHPYTNASWNGVKITRCYDPEFMLGTAGQFIYDLNCIRDTRKNNFDIVLMLGYTSSSVWKKLYPENAVVITNMDGLEWKRIKYSRTVRKFLSYLEKLAIRSRNFIIADSMGIKKYLDEKYRINCTYIPYGAEIMIDTDEAIFENTAIEKKQYFLLIARLEPENNIEMILDGYQNTSSKLKFVVTGNTVTRYGKYLVNKCKADKRIIFTGAIYNNKIIRSLISNCVLYFHGHSVGGTNPSLLEAMAGRAMIAAHDNTFNQAVLGNDALFFKNENDIIKIMNEADQLPLQDQMVSNNYNKILNEYNWPMIVDRYEAFFYECRGVNKMEVEMKDRYVA